MKKYSCIPEAYDCISCNYPCKKQYHRGEVLVDVLLSPDTGREITRIE